MPKNVGFTLKTCVDCGETKTSEMFVSNRRLCKSCRNARKRAEYSPKPTRSDELARARGAGLTHYHSELPCKHGHVGLRLVSTQQCCECLRIRKAAMADPARARQKKWSGWRRKIASQLGKTHYFSGYPCVKGHTGPRLVSTRQCAQCLSERVVNRPAYPLSEAQRARVNAKRRSPAGRIKNREYYREKLAHRLDIRLTRFMRACLRRTRVGKNEQRTFEVLGYTSEQLHAHLEALFTLGMRWSNYGSWQVDHIKPISAFLAEGVTDPKIVNALSNLQPLWQVQNGSKGSKFSG